MCCSKIFQAQIKRESGPDCLAGISQGLSKHLAAAFEEMLGMVEAVGAQLMEFGSSPVWEQYLKEWRGRRLGRGLEQLLLFIIHFFPNIHQHGHTKIVFFLYSSLPFGDVSCSFNFCQDTGTQFL